eukprot:1460868-Pleurochrysis_carterae.AAC.1
MLCRRERPWLWSASGNPCASGALGTTGIWTTWMTKPLQRRVAGASGRSCAWHCRRRLGP